MIFTVNVKLALCMLVVLPFTALTTYSQSKRVRPAFQKIRLQFSSLNTFVQENISGNRVVKAFAREDFEIEKVTESTSENIVESADEFQSRKEFDFYYENNLIGKVYT